VFCVWIITVKEAGTGWGRTLQGTWLKDQNQAHLCMASLSAMLLLLLHHITRAAVMAFAVQPFL
jgi:hypothetical protein